MFSTNYDIILKQISRIDPIKYSGSRNYIDGAVTYLSPYISRGVISTKQVLEMALSLGHEPLKIEKFIQELAWRDYWQQKWNIHSYKINEDLKQTQPLGVRHGIPTNLVEYKTGILAIDVSIEEFYKTGYLHNHLRMYIASMACNIARCHWKIPAQWMYYYLLDADWASNALSWQWVSGANSSKLYYANQENINKYCHTNSRNTFLDVSYEELANMFIPTVLEEIQQPFLSTPLPQTERTVFESDLPTVIYNFYNLDPLWRNEIKANRVLLLEPSVFLKYPVSKKSIDFCIALAKENIPNIAVFVGEFSDLQNRVNGQIYFKEHPLNHYVGCEDSRSWMTTVNGDFPSFFAFWKKCKKELF